MQIRKNEITTGLLVLATFGALVAVLVLVGMPGLIKPLNTYRIYYDNAKGIRPGDPVLLAGREIGKVKDLESPVPMGERPQGHEDYEVALEVRVDRKAPIYNNVTVQLTQNGLMGQMVIDFVKGDENTGLAPDGTKFTGERVPDLSESVSNQIKKLTEPGSDLAETLRNTKELMAKINQPEIPQIIRNTEQMTDTLKREPWRILWPSKKKYEDDPDPEEKKKEKKEEKKRQVRDPAPERGKEGPRRAEVREVRMKSSHCE